MEIVIEISEDEYEWVKRANRQTTPLDRFCVKAIANGTPLPKHHGDLIDRNEFIKNLRDSKKGFWRKKFFVNGEATMESMAYEINDIKKILNDAPTIIEAEGE